jgi:hypothetical protein
MAQLLGTDNDADYSELRHGRNNVHFRCSAMHKVFTAHYFVTKSIATKI